LKRAFVHVASFVVSLTCAFGSLGSKVRRLFIKAKAEIYGDMNKNFIRVLRNKQQQL